MADRQTTVLDARAMARTLRRMADEIVELNDGTDDLIIVGIQRRGVQLATRIAASIDEREGVRRAAAARSTSRSTATTSRPSARARSSGRRTFRGHRRQARRHRRRRALHGPHRARRARRAGRLRPARAHRARGARSTAAAASCRSSRRRRQDASSVGAHRPRRRARRGARRRDAVVVVATRGARRDARRSARICSGSSRSPREQIRLILDTAEPFKEISERAIKKVPTLRGSTIVNLFFEASTRTRISFEFAEKRLSADTVNVAASGSSVTKGETLVDTARNLEAMRIDMVVIRHGASGAAQFLAERIESNVINAGDGTHEHPTQGLLDLLTLRDHFGDARGHDASASVGDVLHSRVARSNIWGLKKLGAEVGVCGPRSLLPNAIDELGVTVFDRIEEAIEWADALNVLRLQLERMQARLHPVAARVQSRVRRDARAARARAARHAHPSSGPDEPRRRDRFRRRRRAAQRDPRPGDERRRGPHGGALSARRRAAGAGRSREGRKRR